MKTIDNYKNIRRKALIIGLSPMFFFIFFAITAVSCLSLVAGISLLKIAIIVGVITCTYGICYFFNQNDLLANIMNKKFPKEVSNLTEND